MTNRAEIEPRHKPTPCQDHLSRYQRAKLGLRRDLFLCPGLRTWDEDAGCYVCDVCGAHTIDGPSGRVEDRQEVRND